MRWAVLVALNTRHWPAVPWAAVDENGFGGYTALISTVVSQHNFRVNYERGRPDDARLTRLLLAPGADPNVRGRWAEHARMEYTYSGRHSAMDMTKYMDPARGTRRWITAGLVAAGAIAGAAVGVALTPLGKMVAGAPPADAANYLRNAYAFAALGAGLAPAVIWTTLRSVPLWRTIAEPLAGCLIGAGIGALTGSGAGLLALVPIGGAVAAARLAVVHRSRARLDQIGSAL